MIDSTNLSVPVIAASGIELAFVKDPWFYYRLKISHIQHTTDSCYSKPIGVPLWYYSDFRPVVLWYSSCGIG